MADRPETLEAAIEQAVDAGYQFLLETYGPDIVREIDLEDLEMSDGLRCMLGQAEQLYVAGLAGLPARLRVRSAFDLDDNDWLDNPKLRAYAEDTDLEENVTFGVAANRLDLDGFDPQGNYLVHKAALLGFFAGYLPYDGEGTCGLVEYGRLHDAWSRKLRALIADGHQEV